MKILTQKGYSFSATSESEIARVVKEIMCNMRLDYDTELYALFLLLVSSSSWLFLVHSLGSISYRFPWVCKWKPFGVPRGDTFLKPYLEEWEQEDDDPSQIHAEEGKNSHRSRSFSRTTASREFAGS